MADVMVSVHFDPCALDSHEWRRLSYGLGRMFGAETCHSCGETRFPMSDSGSWTSRIDWESKLRERFPNGVTPVQTPFMALRAKKF